LNILDDLLRDWTGSLSMIIVVFVQCHEPTYSLNIPVVATSCDGGIIFSFTR
jgi:hypothetical protein